MAVGNVVVQGALRMTRLPATLSTLAFGCFLIDSALYPLGLLITGYCFDPDPRIATRWMMLMHLVGSVGHHIIIYGSP